MKYYKMNSVPLIRIIESDINEGQIVYDELGNGLQKVLGHFAEVHESVLHYGELISDLTNLQLDLFWTLSKNKRKS